MSTTTAWRIVKAIRANEAFSGRGALRAGGRWNHPGTAMVYTASSLALAALEILVHLNGPQLLLSYVQIPVEFGDRQCRYLDVGILPPVWSDDVAHESTRNIGTAWFDSQDSVVLAVPSAIVPDELVYLINPRHPEFPALRIGHPASFRFDPRLVRDSS